MATTGERVIAFIERYCRVPEGSKVGQPVKLLPFQRKFILDVYDNPAGTRRAYLSIARKNGKSALIACLVLAHVAGPVAVQNSQIICGAQSRGQAGIIFRLALQMRNMDPDLRALIRAVESQKALFGLAMGVEFRAISAEATTAHGLSPVVAILDEVGQVKGPRDPFVEAIRTAQGAYENGILFAISTQAPTDADLFSVWLDDAEMSGDPKIVSHVYTAPEDCDVLDETAWRAANPALGEFRSAAELKAFAEDADRSPPSENSFRWLYLNQRIEAASPFINRSTWKSCDAVPLPIPPGAEVYAGLDLSAVQDLTAFVAIWAGPGGVWQVHPTFWLPEEGIAAKSRRDRVPYDDWAKQGLMELTPGRSIDFEYVAGFIERFRRQHHVRRIGYDRWGVEYLNPPLLRRGFTDADLYGDEALFVPFGQGFQSMSPALLAFEAAALKKQIAHGANPVLEMCAKNATVKLDDAGNRKLSKRQSRGRIDGMVALTQAIGVASRATATPTFDVLAMIA